MPMKAWSLVGGVRNKSQTCANMFYCLVVENEVSSDQVIYDLPLW